MSGDHFAIIANWWRIAFVSPFAIYSPLCETSINKAYQTKFEITKFHQAKVLVTCLIHLTEFFVNFEFKQSQHINRQQIFYSINLLSYEITNSLTTCIGIREMLFWVKHRLKYTFLQLISIALPCHIPSGNSRN